MVGGFTHARTHAHVHTHTYTHTRTHTCTHAHVHTHVHTLVHTHARAHTHTCTCTYIHTHTHTYIHTRTHMHTHKPHTHTHTRKTVVSKTHPLLVPHQIHILGLTYTEMHYWPPQPPQTCSCIIARSTVTRRSSSDSDLRNRAIVCMLQLIGEDRML